MMADKVVTYAIARLLVMKMVAFTHLPMQAEIPARPSGIICFAITLRVSARVSAQVSHDRRFVSLNIGF